MKDLKFIQEKWLPCPGFENSYEVSNYGKVRSIDRYISEELSIKLHIVRQIISGKSWKSNKTPLMKRDDRSKTKKPILCVN